MKTLECDRLYSFPTNMGDHPRGDKSVRDHPGDNHPAKEDHPSVDDHHWVQDLFPPTFTFEDHYEVINHNTNLAVFLALRQTASNLTWS